MLFVSELVVEVAKLMEEDPDGWTAISGVLDGYRHRSGVRVVEYWIDGPVYQKTGQVEQWFLGRAAARMGARKVRKFMPPEAHGPY